MQSTDCPPTTGPRLLHKTSGTTHEIDENVGDRVRQSLSETVEQLLNAEADEITESGQVRTDLEVFLIDKLHIKLKNKKIL